KVVRGITAFLFNDGPDEDPAKFQEMNELFSQGTNIRGNGFLVGENGEPTTSSDLETLLQKYPQYSSRIYPYLGGEEINQDPTQSGQRSIIFLSDLDKEEDLEPW